MTAKKTDAYDRVQVQGHTLNRRTLAAFLTAQARPKDDDDWTIYQGSYNAGEVTASAGTHDGGGAIDISPYNWKQRVHALRAVGFAAWHRPAIPGLWGEHIHCILLGDREMSASAKAQTVDYRNGRDGLADHAPDHTWRPSPILVFDYPAYLRNQRKLSARLEAARALLKRVIRALIAARKRAVSRDQKAEIQDRIDSLRHSH